VVPQPTRIYAASARRLARRRDSCMPTQCTSARAAPALPTGSAPTPSAPSVANEPTCSSTSIHSQPQQWWSLRIPRHHARVWISCGDLCLRCGCAFVLVTTDAAHACAPDGCTDVVCGLSLCYPWLLLVQHAAVACCCACSCTHYDRSLRTGKEQQTHMCALSAVV
jgi:hypothetical protein